MYWPMWGAALFAALPMLPPGWRSRSRDGPSSRGGAQHSHRVPHLPCCSSSVPAAPRSTARGATSCPPKPDRFGFLSEPVESPRHRAARPRPGKGLHVGGVQGRRGGPHGRQPSPKAAAQRGARRRLVSAGGSVGRFRLIVPVIVWVTGAGEDRGEDPRELTRILSFAAGLRSWSVCARCAPGCVCAGQGPRLAVSVLALLTGRRVTVRVMADSAAVRTRRSRAHSRGDHRNCLVSRCPYAGQVERDEVHDLRSAIEVEFAGDRPRLQTARRLVELASGKGARRRWPRSPSSTR